jgi:hypothetical protein
MSIVADFWTYAKKDNSTKVPVKSGSNTVKYNVEFIENTSLLDPSIRVLTTMSTALTKYNYCDMTIDSHKRYYKILDWEYTIEGWIAHCHIDVLTTYKSSIGASTQYITRSSHSSDGNIIDNFYQLKTNPTVYHGWVDSTQPWLANIENGVYILGVISPNPQFGSISYYAVPPASLAVICNFLLNDAITAPDFSVADGSLALQKSLIDPFQYIKSCIFLPITYSVTPGADEQQTFPIWTWNIPNCQCKRLIPTAPYFEDSRQFTMPKHPQTDARGNFLNTSPYTIAELYFPPFGTIRLDTSVTCDYPHLYNRYRVDLATGIGTLWVYATKSGPNSDKVIIANVETQVGVPIQLSQVTRDYLGAAGGFVGAAASFLSGNIVGGIAGLVGSAATAIYPHTSSIGSGGTYYQLNFDASLNMVFYPVIQEDNDRFGRPLCGPGKISDYPGYLEVQNFLIEVAWMTSTEFVELKNICESGFYYE